jgi:23S rRNA pseudouridine955/2504/2580 synthase
MYNMEMIKITISENEEKQRLDRFLKKYLRNAPLSYLYKLIRKNVKVNGRRASEETILSLGDEVSIFISQEEADLYQQSRKNPTVRKQFRIAYEDEHVLIVEKPFGLLTHGTDEEKKNTLSNQVLAYLIESGAYSPRTEKTFVPSPVNRLDRNTTGLVLFGKSYNALKSLNQMIREGNYVRKLYMTIVVGDLKENLRLTDKMLRLTDSNKTVIMGKDEVEGKEMETLVRPVSGNGRFTMVEVELITGRTHQIRAHLASAGYPIIGDEKYGDHRVNQDLSRRFDLTTQLLHAYQLSFEKGLAPLDYLQGKVVEAPLPAQFDQIRRALLEK